MLSLIHNIDTDNFPVKLKYCLNLKNPFSTNFHHEQSGYLNTPNLRDLFPNKMRRVKREKRFSERGRLLENGLEYISGMCLAIVRVALERCIVNQF